MQGNASDEVEFTLYNTLGQLVKRDILDYSNGSLFHTFRYDVLPAGVYKLRVRAGNNSAVVQVIVQ
ncbi:MAG: T9SS type A sorting domain-containing protein [Bacteroidetes bacterium]|nr:T9SS type A sorting domain-containing protein [Bacteroidota bacterium]